MTQENKSGWFQRLKAGLQRSSTKLSNDIASIVTKRKLDNETLEELEELLIQSDLGVRLSEHFIQALSKTRFNQEVTSEEIREALAQEIENTLTPVAMPLTIDEKTRPYSILVVGVNGSGKTTTIGKLAKYWRQQGLNVRLVAGDTFRAAAVEQLQIWGNRIGAPVEHGQPGTDAASLAYTSLEHAHKENDDIIILDTAGRLHNKADLMAELEKIRRVMQKVDPHAPHSCLLVLDATTGQNAISQVETFANVVNVTGLVMTKLDGTARGGVLVNVAERFKLPIHFIGVGEGEDDLRPFDAKDFARQLVGLEE